MTVKGQHASKCSLNIYIIKIGNQTSYYQIQNTMATKYAKSQGPDFRNEIQRVAIIGVRYAYEIPLQHASTNQLTKRI